MPIKNGLEAIDEIHNLISNEKFISCHILFNSNLEEDLISI